MKFLPRSDTMVLGAPYLVNISLYKISAISLASCVCSGKASVHLEKTVYHQKHILKALLGFRKRTQYMYINVSPRKDIKWQMIKRNRMSVSLNRSPLAGITSADIVCNILVHFGPPILLLYGCKSLFDTKMSTSGFAIMIRCQNHLITFYCG